MKKPAWKEPPSSSLQRNKETLIEVRWLNSSTPPQIFLPKEGNPKGVSVMARDALPKWTLMEGEAYIC